ncbi:hypothetical protein TELCIR_01561 [Teladorsagia circumcincta]|uniref:Neurotransmitter-gated ion-channel ligand-binding domain-containing protein n=1 Tax=Teladorsagia circumcincta TaxID=45464 RepID=A0A2G9V349_TELCI|nr:hypothetical protein TELCIR_01561 [Teladorsagia circumcincta]
MIENKDYYFTGLTMGSTELEGSCAKKSKNFAQILTEKWASQADSLTTAWYPGNINVFTRLQTDIQSAIDRVPMKNLPKHSFKTPDSIKIGPIEIDDTRVVWMIVDELNYWIDEFLQWNPSSYEGATEIFLASSDVWIPEFSLYYSPKQKTRSGKRRGDKGNDFYAGDEWDGDMNEWYGGTGRLTHTQRLRDDGSAVRKEIEITPPDLRDSHITLSDLLTRLGGRNKASKSSGMKGGTAHYATAGQ